MLTFQKILLSDHSILWDLMQKIYPPAYAHFWKDGGKSYLEKLYSEENLERELAQANCFYAFVKYAGETVGILKVLENEPMPPFLHIPMTMLQRIYLAQSVQGKGVGSEILKYTEEKFCAADGRPLWLEVMDTQEQALKFYKKAGFVRQAKFTFDSQIMHENRRGLYRMMKEGLKAVG